MRNTSSLGDKNPLIKEYSVIGSTTASKTVSMGSSPITLANQTFILFTYGENGTRMKHRNEPSILYGSMEWL